MTFLIEIGVEELPAIPFLKEYPHLLPKWHKALKAHRFDRKLEDWQLHYTPRRLILSHGDFQRTQDDYSEEFFGAPLDLAYKDGEPTPIVASFAKKNQLDLQDISQSEKNGKAVLYAKKTFQGEDIALHIQDLVNQWLADLSFGKAMRWGNLSVAFIRPIRSLLAKLDDESLHFEGYGVQSNDTVFLHRQNDQKSATIAKASDYVATLEQGGVIASQVKRLEVIQTQIKTQLQEQNWDLIEDNDLLQEVVAITEQPKALIGHFDEKFLQLPREVIVHTLRDHQRYFALQDHKGAIVPYFVVVADTLSEDGTLIIKGNEKVLSARLEDALFFYQNDLARGLCIDGLKDVGFMKGMGSMLDKVQREQVIAKHLSEVLQVPYAPIQRAMALHKADLLSEMVYEFTDLQGIMGGYYAKALGESDEVAMAIREQYLPTGEQSDLPSTRTSAIVALSGKLDLLMTLFGLGQIPTGSKDPYALRRNVIGIIKITQSFGLDLDILEVLRTLQGAYGAFDAAKALEFVYERLYQYFDVNKSLVVAIQATGESNLKALEAKLKALQAISMREDFRDNFATFKRVANILQDDDLSVQGIDESLLSNAQERDLYDALQQVSAHDVSYDKHLEALFGLKGVLQAFFDHVMVNDDNPAIRTNRRNILKGIYAQFRRIADIKLISI